MKNTVRRLATLALASLLPLLAVPSHAQDIKERKIKFAYLNQAGHPQDLGAKRFAELVAKASGGKLQVRTFPGGTLGGDLQNVSAVQGGTLEMTSLNAGILSNQVKELGVFDLPFLFANPAEADAIADGPLGRKLLGLLAAKGLIGLDYWDLGFRNVTNNRRPITKVEDIAGLKIRVIQSPIYVDMFNALGANATPMAYPEVYGALESRAIDGQENPFTTIRASKLSEVQKYLSVTNHIYNPMALVMSKTFWDKLSDDEKKIITDASREATKYQRQVSRQQADEALADLKKAGMQVNELPPAELARMREKVKPVVEQHADKVGKEVLNEVHSELAKLRK